MPPRDARENVQIAPYRTRRTSRRVFPLSPPKSNHVLWSSLLGEGNPFRVNDYSLDLYSSGLVNADVLSHRSVASRSARTASQSQPPAIELLIDSVPFGLPVAHQEPRVAFGETRKRQMVEPPRPIHFADCDIESEARLKHRVRRITQCGTMPGQTTPQRHPSVARFRLRAGIQKRLTFLRYAISQWIVYEKALLAIAEAG